jgi:hypothetical protein
MLFWPFHRANWECDDFSLTFSYVNFELFATRSGWFSSSVRQILFFDWLEVHQKYEEFLFTNYLSLEDHLEKNWPLSLEYK